MEALEASGKAGASARHDITSAHHHNTVTITAGGEHPGATPWRQSLGVAGGKAGAAGEMGSHRVQSMHSGRRGPGSWVLLIGRWFLVVIVVGLVVSWSPPSLLFGPQSAVPGSSRCHQPSSRFCAPVPPPLAILHPCLHCLTCPQLWAQRG